MSLVDVFPDQSIIGNWIITYDYPLLRALYYLDGLQQWPINNKTGSRNEVEVIDGIPCHRARID